jgi:hypothetical protein
VVVSAQLPPLVALRAISYAVADGRAAEADLRIAAPPPPLWMIELAEQVKMIEPGTILPTGVILGSAVIARCIQNDGHYEWHLRKVQRLSQAKKPTRHPQPVWFKPF